MAKKLTTAEFIERAKKIHRGKYDYSKVDFVKTTLNVTIICPEHGEFVQSPKSHLNGKGCPDCGLKSRAKKRKLTTAIFIERARDIHGDKYNYSKVVYVKNNSNVIIICPEHGEFEQSPASHFNGRGCPDCGLVSRAKKNTLITEDFLEKAKAVHGDTYSYTKAVYTKAKEKLLITCKIHGDFEQTPLHHLDGQGCPMCGIALNTTNRSSNTDEFIARATKAHAGKYIYDAVVYKTSVTKVLIGCPEHGLFEQIPSNHLKGVGCPVCGSISMASKSRSNTEEFIAKAKAIHGNSYQYHKVNYNGAFEKVTIVCPEHGDFEQAATDHLSGRGCSSCANSGFQRDKPAILYYLRIEDMTRTVYKIGITNRTVEDRFRPNDLSKISVLNVTHFDNGVDCYEAEQKILKQFDAFKYIGEDMLADGNTELFTCDVLGLDDYK